MANKRANMQAVLERQAKGRTPDPVPDPAPATPAGTTTPKQPSRVGKVNITGYFAPAVKSSFRMIQTTHPEKTIQDLLAEALNDLFAKYNVPQTAHLAK
jgi:antitoxin-like ribbon-helix-helix protein